MLFEDDEEEKEEKEEKDEGVANSVNTQQTRQALGPFMPREGWEIVPLPEAANSQENWAKLATKSWWRNKKLAHIFDDEWDEGVFKNKLTDDGQPHWDFYYHKNKLRYVHSLLLEEHGMAASWVVIKPASRR